MIMIKHYFTLANLLLMGAAVYVGVNTFYMVTSANLERLEPVPAETSGNQLPAAERRYPLSHYSAIAARNLFKTKTDPGGTVPAAVNVEALEQTQLKLKLWGTVTGTGEKDYAVIEEAGQRKQNLYRVGDTIQDATVKLILREKVVLTVNGKDEVLEIEKTTGIPGAVGAMARLPGPSTMAGQLPTPTRIQRITLRRSQIDSAIQDVNQLLTEVNIRPHFQQGQPDGIMLSRIKPNSLFIRMGLRNGDIISGVNGRSIQSVDDALGFYESLKSSDNVTLQLKRGGRERNIEYAIK
jgi:general secretion pathway protein C